MNPLEKVALTVLLLAVLIFVHELGHFLVAKAFKVKVLKFSLGFGPKLLGFTWGETEYLISAVPLGGYVKMAGDEPGEEVVPEDKGRGFLEQAPWKRALIGLAGPAMNLIFPIFVYFAAFYLQTTDISSRLGRVVPDQPAYAAGLRSGDRITAVDGQPVKYFSELQRLISPKWDVPVQVTFERGGKAQTVAVTPQKTEDRNILETETRGVIGVAPMASAPLVGITDPRSPAARAGVQSFDRLVKVDGKQIDTYPDLEQALVNRTDPVQVTVIRDVPEGGAAGALTVYQSFEATLTPEIRDGVPFFGLESTEQFVFSVDKGTPAWDAGLRRGDKLVSANGTVLDGWSSFERIRREQKDKPLALVLVHQGERIERTLMQKETVEHDEFENPIPVLQFGAHRDNRYTSFVESEQIPIKLSVGEALSRSLSVVPDEIRKTGLVLARLVQGRLSFKSVGGPIMMYDIASRAAEAGMKYFLQIMALISINLGIMNLLPVPILDGFHILSAGIEAVRGRPMSVQVRTIANYIGLAMLLTLMVFVFKNDIVRFILN
ncbi:MAG TPA: RIP metalloprotease RseP [Myxococcales bacterium]|jgi:regulator of sigma E protease